MKRRAILIGSPSYKENGDYLSGVKTDIENMYRFLRSSIGGSWQKEEINFFYPNEKWINIARSLQDAESADMSFVGSMFIFRGMVIGIVKAIAIEIKLY